MSSTTEQQDQTVARAAEALLREHPDALVCALSTNGLIVPLPGTVELWGQAAIEGRAVIDAVVAADRAEVGPCGTESTTSWRSRARCGC